MLHSNRKSAALALGAALIGSAALSNSGFAMTDLGTGYMLGAAPHETGHDQRGPGSFGGDHRHTLADMDINNDGAVSESEFATLHQGGVGRFTDYDADKNGVMTQLELDTGHARSAAVAVKTQFEGKCGVKCGEGKCGEGQCGCDPTKLKNADGKAPAEGKCGEGKCGGAS